MKEKEIHKDMIRTIQEALDTKICQLVENSNKEKAQNVCQRKCREQKRADFRLEEMLVFCNNSNKEKG